MSNNTSGAQQDRGRCRIGLTEDISEVHTLRLASSVRGGRFTSPEPQQAPNSRTAIVAHSSNIAPGHRTPTFNSASSPSPAFDPIPSHHAVRPHLGALVPAGARPPSGAHPERSHRLVPGLLAPDRARAHTVHPLGGECKLARAVRESTAVLRFAWRCLKAATAASVVMAVRDLSSC